MMINKIKEVGKGTIYEFEKHRIETQLPSKRRRNVENKVPMILHNEWYDKSGNYYKLSDNILLIVANEYFPEEQFSIIDYINQLPIGCKVILKIKSKPNCVAGYNMLFNALSVFPTNKNVIIDMSSFSFSEKIALDIEKLPDNVKITCMLDIKNQEHFEASNESFESWSLNCSEQDFKSFLTKLTSKTRYRIFRIREIALNFYKFLPSEIKDGTNWEKIQFVYNWCRNNIEYDYSAIKSDRTLRWDRKDSQDPIFTFDRRKGVCVGRARLLKILLNNYYMKVPCFLVKGMSGCLQHAWNEAILEDGSIVDMDISKQTNRKAWDHKELIYYDADLHNNSKRFQLK